MEITTNRNILGQTILLASSKVVDHQILYQTLERRLERVGRMTGLILGKIPKQEIWRTEKKQGKRM